MFKLKLLLLSGFVAISTGCAQFDNRLTRTVSGDRYFVTSLYYRFGITAELSADDARELKRMEDQATAFRMLQMLQGSK